MRAGLSATSPLHSTLTDDDRSAVGHDSAAGRLRRPPTTAFRKLEIVP
jgi:hypothetical protein